MQSKKKSLRSTFLRCLFSCPYLRQLAAFSFSPPFLKKHLGTKVKSAIFKAEYLLRVTNLNKLYELNIEN